MVTSQPEAGWTVFVLPSSHNDIGWAGTPSEIAEHRVSSIFDTVLSMMERDPTYAFAMEAGLYLREYLERRPERSALISRYLDDGRLECGASYIQPYEGLLGGESLVRQFYWGRRWMREELGTDAAGYWNIDVEARTVQLPQILSKAGVRYMVLSRNRPGLYWWQAPNGSRILVLSFMEGAYGRAQVFNTLAAHFSPLDAARAYGLEWRISVDVIARELLPLLRKWEPFYADHHLPRYMLVAATADYAVPDERIQGLVHEWNSRVERGDLSLPMPVRLRFGNVAQYVAALEGEADLSKLPTISGELPNPWVYIHGPCHHKTVRAMREGARSLTTAETFTTVRDVIGATAARDGTGGERADLSRAWLAHLYPDHGYGGLHGEGTDEIFRYKEEAAWFDARRIARQAMTSVAQGIRYPENTTHNLVIFNPLSWSRTDWVEAEVYFSPEETITAVQVVDSDGSSVSMQALEVARNLAGDLQRLRLGFIARDVPSVGYRTFHLVRADGAEIPVGLPSLEARLPADYTWDNPYLHVRTSRGGLVECVDKVHGRGLLAADHFLGFEVIELGSPGHDVGEGERDITVFDWLAVRPFQPTWSGLERTSERAGRLTLLENGPARTRVTMESAFSHCTIRQTFAFYRELDRVDIAVDVLAWNGAQGRELRLLFPLGTSRARISYDVPFGHLVIGQDELDGFAGIRPREVQNWLHADGDGLAATLSSSVVAHDWIDPIGFTDRPVLQAVLLATKRSCHPKGPWYTQEGNHSFWASITGMARSPEECARFGWARQQPLDVIVVPSAQASGAAMPAIQSFLSIEPENVMVTSLKWSDDGEDLIVRCYETKGEATIATLQCPIPVRALWRCDLLEDNQELLWQGAEPAQRVSAPLEAFGIATLRLKP